MPLTLAIIAASTRTGRKGPAVAAWVIRTATADARFKIATHDLADHDLPLLDEPSHPSLQDYRHAHTKRWSAAITAADALLFVTPEYDYFPPASVVNAVQYLSKEWKYKPAGVVSYGGISGGLRSTQELRLLLSNVGMVPIMESVPIRQFTRLIQDDGSFAPEKPMETGLALVLDELHKLAEVLAPLRAARA